MTGPQARRMSASAARAEWNPYARRTISLALLFSASARALLKFRAAGALAGLSAALRLIVLGQPDANGSVGGCGTGGPAAGRSASRRPRPESRGANIGRTRSPIVHARGTLPRSGVDSRRDAAAWRSVRFSGFFSSDQRASLKVLAGWLSPAQPSSFHRSARGGLRPAPWSRAPQRGSCRSRLSPAARAHGHSWRTRRSCPSRPPSAGKRANRRGSKPAARPSYVPGCPRRPGRSGTGRTGRRSPPPAPMTPAPPPRATRRRGSSTSRN